MSITTTPASLAQRMASLADRAAQVNRKRQEDRERSQRLAQEAIEHAQRFAEALQPLVGVPVRYERRWHGETSPRVFQGTLRALIDDRDGCGCIWVGLRLDDQLLAHDQSWLAHVEVMEDTGPHLWLPGEDGPGTLEPITWESALATMITEVELAFDDGSEDD